MSFTVTFKTSEGEFTFPCESDQYVLDAADEAGVDGPYSCRAGACSTCEGNIQKAKLNVEIYLHNPVGIGEHPDVLGAIQEQLDIIAHEEERLEVIDRHFLEHP